MIYYSFMVPIEKSKNHPIYKQYNITYSFACSILGVVWGVANCTGLLFFPGGNPDCKPGVGKCWQQPTSNQWQAGLINLSLNSTLIRQDVIG